MKHTLLPVYKLIKTLTTERNWKVTYANDVEAQEYMSLMIAAFALDIALDLNPLDPNSASQIVRAELDAEMENEND